MLVEVLPRVVHVERTKFLLATSQVAKHALCIKVQHLNLLPVPTALPVNSDLMDKMYVQHVLPVSTRMLQAMDVNHVLLVPLRIH
jgi:hypothetical protein